MPYPPISGGTIKSWNYVNFLAKKYEVTVACLLKNEDSKNQKEFEAHLDAKDYIYHSLDISRSLINLVFSYLKGCTLNIYRNRSNEFRSKIKSIADDFDMIIVDHYEMFQYVPKNYHGKKVLHTHNAEFMLWKRMFSIESNPLVKLALLLEARRVKKSEKSIFKQSHLIYASPSDIEIYGDHGFPNETLRSTYHLGNDQLLNEVDIQFEDTELAITFMGTLSWEPNIDGIVWFLRNVWPMIRKEQPDAKLYILGSKPGSRIQEARGKDENVIFTGFVTDINQYLEKSRVYIAPLRIGSGMKVKVLEGLYRGIPTVTTSVGAEGLDVVNQKEIYVTDQAEKFAQYCIRLLKDQQQWKSMRDLSRQKAKEKYRWQPMFEEMDKHLLELNSDSSY